MMANSVYTGNPLLVDAVHLWLLASVVSANHRFAA
jgi:hypothetical protein